MAFCTGSLHNLIFLVYLEKLEEILDQTRGPRSEISDSWLGQTKVNEWVSLLTFTVSLISVSLSREPLPKNPAQGPRQHQSTRSLPNQSDQNR